MTSPNLTDVNIDKLAELFPTVITETADSDGHVARGVDFDLLRQELSDHIVEGPQERYRLDWPGKRAAAFAGNAPIAKTLRPVREESVNFDTTKNLFIEGDNLDVLKLLQESYLSKVKIIYIDPPYNTGHDRLYDDDFSEPTDGYLNRSGQTSYDGTKFVSNTEANGRFHSAWLDMIYPRLKLARNLLTDDGFIFISIDDNEHANLRRVCDEVFGTENFVATFAWQKTLTRRNDATYVSSAHEYVVAYARKYGDSRFNQEEAGEKQRATYSNRDNDPRGDWLAVPFHAPNIRPNLTYPITTPSGRILMPPSGRCWSTTRQQYEELLADGRIYFGKNGDGMAQRKKFWSERDGGMIPWSWWPYTEAGENREATKEVKNLFDGDTVFSGPKPTKLILKILKLVPLEEGDIVLDFFAGSGTTADAVMNWTADGHNRLNFILVQAPELCDAGSVARQSGYQTISALARERMQRAGSFHQAQSGLEGDGLDFGFRSLCTDTSGMKRVSFSSDEITQLGLEALENTLVDGRSSEDLLFQVLLDWGLELSMPIAKEYMYGQELFTVEDDALVACFDAVVKPEVVHEMARRQPLRAVFRDDGFTDDSARINAEQIFRELSPATDVKAI